MSYQIITDTCCDLPESLISSLGLRCVNLTLNFRDQVLKNITDWDLKTVYAVLRNGEVATTAAANPED